MTASRVVRATVLACAVTAVALAAAAPAADPAPESDPSDHRASTSGTQPRNEPSVAVHPADPRRVATAANDYDSPTVGVYLSADGGRTFAVRSDPPGLPGAVYGSDPHLVWSRGDLYAAYLSYSPRTDGPGGLVVARRSSVRGTWTIGVPRRNAVVDEECRFADFPALAVDRRREVLHVAWQEITFTGANCQTYDTLRLYTSRSADGGRTWSAPAPIPYDGFGYLPSLAIGRRGEVLVTFNDTAGGALGDPLCPAGSVLVRSLLSRSADGGRRFSAPVEVQQRCLPQPPVGLDVPELGMGTQSLTGATYRLPASSNTVVDPRDGRLVSVLGGSDGRTTQQLVYVSASTDGGRTWSDLGPVPSVMGENQQFPRLAVGRDGRLSLVWIAQLPGGLLWASHAWSFDGGRTWTEPERIAAVPSRVGHPNFQGFIGDYLGNDVDSEGRAHPVWTDMREVQELNASTTYTRALAPPAS